MNHKNRDVKFVAADTDMNLTISEAAFIPASSLARKEHAEAIELYVPYRPGDMRLSDMEPCTAVLIDGEWYKRPDLNGLVAKERISRLQSQGLHLTKDKGYLSREQYAIYVSKIEPEHERRRAS